MKQSYYLWMNDQESGPFSSEDVASMVDTGAISVATLARKNQNADWDGLENFLPEIHRAKNWRREAESVMGKVHKEAPLPVPTEEAPSARPYSSDVNPTILRAIGMFVMFLGFLGVGVVCAALPVFVDGVANPERLNLRLCLAIAGSTLFLAGVIMMATAYIVGHLQNLKGQNQPQWPIPI